MKDVMTRNLARIEDDLVPGRPDPCKHPRPRCERRDARAGIQRVEPSAHHEVVHLGHDLAAGLKGSREELMHVRLELFHHVLEPIADKQTALPRAHHVRDRVLRRFARPGRWNMLRLDRAPVIECGVFDEHAAVVTLVPMHDLGHVAVGRHDLLGNELRPIPHLRAVAELM
ncbi:MAG: hypothetical protein AAFR47_05855 [Pseudomonadota bacterium]